MLEKRIIPCLLISEGGVVKTTKFKDPSYVGDPINSVKIFNDKEVDELVVIDIDASKRKQGPNFELLRELADEAFMPMAYGGGLHSFKDIEEVFALGFEKVCLNSANFGSLQLLKAASEKFGAQSVVASVDIKKNLFGKYQIFDHVSGKTLDLKPQQYLKELIAAGAGEIFLNFVDKDGTLSGYDIKGFEQLSEGLEVPMIACGGAKDLTDLKDILNAGADAACAGALFVYHGPHRAVLINYPKRDVVESLIHGRL